MSAARVRIDIAIGADSATGLLMAGRAAHRATVPFSLPAEPEATATAFASAFQSLAAKLGEAAGQPIEQATARIVLMPPFADTRLVPLPPMRSREAEAVLRRDAARYFLGDVASRVVGVAVTSRNGAPVLASAAAVSLAEAIRSACGFLGWRLDAILPAHAAWLALASRNGSSTTGAAVVVAADNGAVHVIRSAGSGVAGIRRLPSMAGADVVEATGVGPGTAMVFADRATRDHLVRALNGAGWMVANANAEPVAAADAAAAGAAGSLLELVPPTLAAQRRDRARSSAWLIAAAAVVLAIGAAALELWGANHELSGIRARRMAIREQVAPLLDARDSVSRLEARARVIERLEQESPRWTRALFDFALLLPTDTHLTMIRTSGDTLVAEATGERASAALQALRRSGSLENIQLVGPVERQLEDGETTTERFRFTAILNRPIQTEPVGAAAAAPADESRKVARRQP